MRLFIYIIFLHFSFSSKVPTRQELAKVEYFNPKYLSEAKAFTNRASRRDAYKTNLTYTSITPVGNNFTLKFQHSMKNLPVDFEIKRKICDMMKIKWIYEFVMSVSDVVNECPFRMRTYHFYNMDLNPKTILMPMPTGVNVLTVVVELTDTGELVFKSTVVVHVF